MSAITKLFVWALTFVAALAGLTLFNWPEIPQEALTFIAQVFGWIKFMDKYIPFQLLLNYSVAIITIEIAIKVLSIYDEIRSALTGSHSMFGVFTGRRTSYRGEDE